LRNSGTYPLELAAPAPLRIAPQRIELGRLEARLADGRLLIREAAWSPARLASSGEFARLPAQWLILAAGQGERLSATLGGLLADSASPRLQFGVLLARRFRRAPDPLERLRALTAEIDALLAAEVAERRADPRDDILSMLIGARFEDGRPMEDAEIRDKSLAALTHALNGGAALGAVVVVLHPGSALKDGGSVEQAIERAGAVIREALEESAEGGILQLEDTAGAGGTLGRSFEELAALIEAAGGGRRIGVCLDSCHLLASGYDIRTAEGLSGVVDEFDYAFWRANFGSVGVVSGTSGAGALEVATVTNQSASVVSESAPPIAVVTSTDPLAIDTAVSDLGIARSLARPGVAFQSTLRSHTSRISNVSIDPLLLLDQVLPPRSPEAASGDFSKPNDTHSNEIDEVFASLEKLALLARMDLLNCLV